MKKTNYVSPGARLIPIMADQPLASSFYKNGFEVIIDQYHDAESEGFSWE